MGDWNAIIIMITSFIAGGGGVFLLNMFKQKREQIREDKKQDNEIRVSETEHAFTIYKEIVSALKHDLEQVNKSFQEQDKQYLEVREQKAILQTKLENTEKRLIETEARIVVLEHKSTT